jgi:2-keto-4-pentenoate hydratase/2-oxohepta-3-ene-1,7-dioic acid hydratase in catechol pathway
VKFVSFEADTASGVGVLDGQGRLRDASMMVPALDFRALPRLDPEALPLVEGPARLHSPIGRPGKFICIGLNYADHAEEAGMAIPSEPIVFMKASSAVCGPNDDLRLPRGSVKTDWEVELGVVIGKPAKYVSQEAAMQHVAGYVVTNDVSERQFQLERQGQWTKGKSCDTFGPIGPWLVTPDEVADPQNLRLWTKVNGQTLQDGSTKTMIFGVAELIAYLSQIMTLEPGDLISTGTPPGVGMGLKPQIFLKDGDVLEIGIDGLGSQRQRVVADA